MEFKVPDRTHRLSQEQFFEHHITNKSFQKEEIPVPVYRTYSMKDL
jgi:hypothetical protein